MTTANLSVFLDEFAPNMDSQERQLLIEEVAPRHPRLVELLHFLCRRVKEDEVVPAIGRGIRCLPERDGVSPRLLVSWTYQGSPPEAGHLPGVTIGVNSKGEPIRAIPQGQSRYRGAPLNEAEIRKLAGWVVSFSRSSL